jgi:hypothetical protein
MDTFESEKYYCDINTLKETLEKYGVAIIPSVINEEECVKMRNGMWESIEHITQDFDKPVKTNKPLTPEQIRENYDKYGILLIPDKIDKEAQEMVDSIMNDKNFKLPSPILKDDISSWSSFPRLFALHSMLIQRWVSHAQYYWDLRQKPEIVDIFAHLWNVKPEELLVSFDGLSLHLPPEKTGRGWYRNNNWTHRDQSFTRHDFECVQSFLSANPINEGDATLTFLEGSHKLGKRAAKKFNITDKADWYKLNEKEYDYFIKKGCEKKCIKCPAGSMVFWDSRLQHQGQEPLKERKVANERCIIYLCYTPRNRATKANLKKKVKAFEELRTTSHWPHKPKLFPENPRTYGAPMPNIVKLPPPVVNDLGKKLIGY